MCDYTQIEFACNHLRYIVRAWCTKYQETHKRCPPNVVAIEYRLDELCGDCKDKKTPNKHNPPKKDGDASSSSSQTTGTSSASG